MIASTLSFGGEPGRALDWLQKGEAMLDFQVAYLAAIPNHFFRGNLNDQRFRALLEGVALPVGEPPSQR